MGIRDILFGRRKKKAMSEQLAKDIYTSFLMDHGYSQKTSRNEANKRMKKKKK